MIQANIVEVVQRMSLGSGTIRNYAVVEVDGNRAEVEVSLEFFKMLVGVAGEQEEAKTAESPAPSPVVTPPQPHMELEPEKEQVLVWEELSDEVLSPMYKTALRVLNVPSRVTARGLQQVLDNINNEFTEEDWAQLSTFEEVNQQVSSPASVSTVGLSPPAQPPVQAPPTSQPSTGQVVWHDGSPILPQRTQSARTVPKNEWGYPIVSNADVDPGEVVGSGDVVDEDGIGQM